MNRQEFACLSNTVIHPYITAFFKTVFEIIGYGRRVHLFIVSCEDLGMSSILCSENSQRSRNSSTRSSCDDCESDRLERGGHLMVSNNVPRDILDEKQIMSRIYLRGSDAMLACACKFYATTSWANRYGN